MLSFLSTPPGLFLFSSFLCFSTLTSAAALPIEESSLETRQAAAIIGVITSVAGLVIASIQEVINIGQLDAKEHDIESAFTQSMVAQLTRQYPDKNVVIYHDQDSQFSGINAAHQHVECNLEIFSWTQGYEVQVFDSGTFTLVGDGGYLNWCFGGNYVRSGNTVTFNPIAAPTQTVAPAPTNPPIPPTNPTRQNPADTDGNYFVNCQKADGTVSSGMAYYRNLVPGSNVGQRPDDYVDVTHGTLVTWESAGAVTFNTGVPVHWSIFGNAQDLGANQSAGAADNMYEHFWVYKDAGEWLYSVDDWNCNSIYWAF